MPIAQPTKEWVIQRATDLQSFYDRRRSNILAWRSLYFMDEEAYFFGADGSFIEQEDDEQRIILPMAHATVDSFKSVLLSRPPVLSVPPSAIKEVHQQQAEAIEKMLYALWTRGNVYEAIDNALWHALVDGWGVLQVRYDPGANEDGDVPIFVKSVDPIGVYPMPSERPGKWEYVIAVYHELAGTLRYRFVDSKDGRTKQARAAKRVLSDVEDDDRITVLEYWDDTYHSLMAIPMDSRAEEPRVSEGDWLLPPQEHRYGALPFFFLTGLTFPFPDRGDRLGVSILWPIEGMIRYMSKLISQKATIIARYANPTLVVKSQDGRGFDFPGLLGGQLGMFPDEDAEYLMPPGPMPAIDIQLEEIAGQVEMAGLPRHMMGQLNVSRLSGVAMNLLRTPVLMRISTKQVRIENALQDMNEAMLRIVENRISNPVYMWGNDMSGEPIEVSLDPEVIRGYYRNRVKLSASLPTDEPAMISILSTLLQQQVISKRTTRDIAQQVLRDMSPQSLEMEEDMIQIENLLAMPHIQMGLMLEAAEEAGMMDVVQQAQQMMGAQQGQGQQGSGPGFPGLGSETGLSPFNPLSQRQGSADTPRLSDSLSTLAKRVADAQGGRPAGPSGAIGSPDQPTEVAG